MVSPAIARPGVWQNGRMAKARETVRVDRDLLAAAARKAARTGQTPEAVVEKALRRYLLDPADILDRLRPQEDLTDEEAMELAYDEIHKMRRGE